MEQVGFVRKVDGDMIELEIRRVSGCGSGCNSCSSNCEVEAHIVNIYNKLNAKVGDFVEVKGEVKSILKYTFIAYMIPLLFTMAGIIAGHYFFKSRNYANYEILSFITGIIFLGVSFLVNRLIDKKIATGEDKSISLVRIL